MREREWQSALQALHKAESISPSLAGIHLNIGLIYYRQSRFRDAIPQFASELRRQPTSLQAKYLLGLCYFFTQQYGESTDTLQSIQEEESNDLNFLYVLAISAWKSNRLELEQRTMARLVQIGGRRPEFHLLMGKAYLNREEYDNAIKELSAAIQAAPKLPFAHFNLGFAYAKKQQFEQAKKEFLEDAEIEPDLAYNYDQLGLIEMAAQNSKKAEEYFLKSLSLDPSLDSSRYQLARIYQDERQYTKALMETDKLLKTQKDSPSVHYLRGQIFQHLGKIEEARAEMRESARVSNAARTARQHELENPLPNPELQQTQP